MHISEFILKKFKNIDILFTAHNNERFTEEYFDNTWIWTHRASYLWIHPAKFKPLM